MKAVVFTSSPRKVQGFKYFAGRGAPDLDVRSLKELKKALPSLEMTPMVYLDVQGLAGKETNRLLALVQANPKVRFTIVDPTGGIEDVASVFHSGAVDYVGRKMLAKAPAGKRQRAAMEYARRVGAGGDGAGPADGHLDERAEAGDGWAEIEPGREHTFALLFVEVDDAEELKKRFEPENLAAAMGTFHDFVEKIVKQHGGRLWMWSRFGGLALFPLHERSPAAAVCGVRILLSSIFYDYEESPLPGRLSFRMALSVGITPYKEGDTGRIVSDAVNSIFHLGRRFTGQGQFLVTADAHELVPQPLRGFFEAAGSYEGRRIHRMRRPTSAAGVR